MWTEILTNVVVDNLWDMVNRSTSKVGQEVVVERQAPSVVVY